MTIIHASIEHDEDGNTYVVTDDRNSDELDTDWAYLDAMTDKEIGANAASDPDTVILTPEQRDRGLLGREIRLLRHSLSLSQEQFADRFGVPADTVAGWERGRRWPDEASRTLLRIIVTNPDLVAQVVQDSKMKKADTAN